MADPQAAVAGVRVPLIDESAATGRTAELYALVKHATGLPFVPDMFRLASTRPDLLEVVIGGFNGIFGGGVLARETKEIISAWTSKLNSCPYCVGTHNYFLRLFGGTEELTEAIKTATSPDELPVDDRTKQLLRLVTKITQAAYKVTDEDWNEAADAGWTNTELLEAVFCSALFNFINRLVDGLGLGTSVSESRISRQPAS
ncbi:MAG TPA: peroxidase [Pseudonocardiaceae bacterium]|nr:peroxidase [Pseudonocardiaceae bacterium]